MKSRSRRLDSIRASHEWKSKVEGGKNLTNRISFDFNNDFEIQQIDVTPYPTEDPFGNSIFLRPKTSQDSRYLIGNHGGEKQILLAALKYIDQQKIDVWFKKNNAKGLINWAKSIAIYDWNERAWDDKKPEEIFSEYDYSIPTIKEDGHHDTYSTYLFSSHRAYISPKGNLLFSIQDISPEKSKNYDVTFTTKDAEELVKGTLFEAAKNPGRRALGQLIDMLEYRFSDDFSSQHKL